MRGLVEQFRVSGYEKLVLGDGYIFLARTPFSASRRFEWRFETGFL